MSMRLRLLLFGLILLVSCVYPQATSVARAGAAYEDDEAQGPAFEVRKALVQDDGRIVVFGIISVGKGTWRSALARYNPDGSVDQQIKQVVVSSGRNSGFIHNLALQAD